MGIFDSLRGGFGKARKEAEELEAPNKYQEVDDHAVKEPQPTSPEKKKFKAVMVDTTDVMKAEARDAADAFMTMDASSNPENLKGLKKFFKGEYYRRTGQKIWKHGLWRDYYRNKEIARVREQILQTGNIYAGEGLEQSAHDKFVADVMEQFSSEYEETIHYDAGETKRVVGEKGPEEEKIKTAVKKLIIQYAQGKISKEAFIEEEKRIFRELKADTEEKKTRKKEEVMHASNFVQIAEQVKLAMAHGEFLENEDFDIELIYGKSKAGVRTEAQFTKAEALAEKLSHTKLGQFVNETTLATSLSIASAVISKGTQMGASTAARILPYVGNMAVTALFAKNREAKKLQEERRQHARDMAKGKDFDAQTMQRRKEMEESRYATEPAQTIIANMERNLEILLANGQNLTPEQLQEALAGFSKVEALIRVSDRKSVDLIEYSDPANVVQERKDIDIGRAKIKAEFRKLFEAGKFSTGPAADNMRSDFNSYLESLSTTSESMIINEGEDSMAAKDRIFNKMKSKKSWKAARRAMITGTLIGLAVEEGVALATDRTSLTEDIYRNIRGTQPNTGGVEQMTSLAYLKNYMMDGFKPTTGGGNLHELVIGENHIKLPNGADMVKNPDGSFNLVQNGNVVAENLTTTPSGILTGEAQAALTKAGVGIENNMITGQATGTVSVEEYINNHPGETHEMRRSWYDNDTAAFDKNELQTHWGGEKGTGIDNAGNYVLDVSQMTPEGSFHKELTANAQELIKEGKLKMLISLSTETQNQVFEIPINADGKIVIDPNSEIGKIAFANVDGNAKFLGRFAEIGQDLGDNKFRMLSTLEGAGLKDVVGATPSTTPETVLSMPRSYDYDMPPFIPIVPRTPLEKSKKYNSDEEVSEQKKLKGRETVKGLLEAYTPEGMQRLTGRPIVKGLLGAYEQKKLNGRDKVKGLLEAHSDTETKRLKGRPKPKGLLPEHIDGEIVDGEVIEETKTLPGRPPVKGLLGQGNNEDIIDAEIIEETPAQKLLGPSEEAEFIRQNPFELDTEKMQQAYQIYEANINKLFPTPKLYEMIWKEQVSFFDARPIFDIDQKEIDLNTAPGKLYAYLRKLYKVTRLVPLIGSGTRYPESVKEYMTRALQKAASLGKLETLRIPE